MYLTELLPDRKRESHAEHWAQYQAHANRFMPVFIITVWFVIWEQQFANLSLRQCLEVIGNHEILNIMECRCAKEHGLRTKSSAWHWLPPSLAAASLPEPCAPPRDMTDSVHRTWLMHPQFCLPVLMACHTLSCCHYLLKAVPPNEMLLGSPRLCNASPDHFRYVGFFPPLDSSTFPEHPLRRALS